MLQFTFIIRDFTMSDFHIMIIQAKRTHDDTAKVLK